MISRWRAVMNPPRPAARGREARNLIAGHVMGMGQVHRAAQARPADAVPPPCAHIAATYKPRRVAA